MECSARVVVPSFPDCMDLTQSKLGYEGKSPRSSIKFKSNLGGIWQLRRVGPPSTVANSASLIRLKEDGKVTIGRGPAADYFLDSAITLRLISRIHASIIGEKQENGWPKFTIVNSGLNGTYINDIKMGFHSENKQILQKGDKITFGHPGCASIQPGHYAPQHDSEFQFILECVSPQQDAESEKLNTHVPKFKCNNSFRQSLQQKLKSVITGENCRTPVFVPNGHCVIESISQLADSPHSNASASEKENHLANSGNEETKPIVSASLDCAILASSSCKQRALNGSNQSDTHSQSADQKLLISSGSAHHVESSMAQAHNVKIYSTVSEDSSQSSNFHELMHMSPSAYRTDGGGVEINSTTIILRDEDSDEGSHSPEIEIVGTLSPNLPTRIKVESGYDDSEAEDVTQAVKASGKSSQGVHSTVTHQDKINYESPAESMLEKRSFLTPTDYRIISKNHLHNASVSPSDSVSRSCESVEHYKAPSPSSSPTSVSPPTLSPQSPFVHSSPQHCSHLQENTNPLHSSDSESSLSSHTTSSLSSSKPSSPTSRTSSRSSRSHTSASLKEPLVRDLVPNMYSSSDEDEIFKENKTSEIVKKIYKSPNKRREAGKSCQVSRRSVLFKSNKRTIDSLKRCTSPLSPSAHNLSSAKILHRRKMNKSDESPSSSDLSDLESVIERDRTGSSYVKLKPKVTLKSLDYSPTNRDSTSLISFNSKSQPSPAPKSHPAPASKSHPAPASKSQPAPASKSQPAPASKSQPAPASKSHPAPASKSQSTSAPKSHLAPASKSQPAPASKSQPAPASKSQPAPASKSQSTSAPKSQSTSAPKSHPAPALTSPPTSQPAPAPKSQSTSAPKSQSTSAPKSQVTAPLSKNAFALNSKESPSMGGKASKSHPSVSSAMPPKDLDLSDNNQAAKPSADHQKSRAPSAMSASHPRTQKLKEKPEPVKLTSSTHNSSLSSTQLSPPSSVPSLTKGSTKAATPGTLAKRNLKPAKESSLMSKKQQSPIVISSSSDISVQEVSSDKKVANKSMYLIDLPLSDSPPLARKPSRTSKKNKSSDLTNNNKLDTMSAPGKTSNISQKGKQKTKSSTQSKLSGGEKRKSEDDLDLSTRKKHISTLANTAAGSKKATESGRLSRNSSTSSATSEMSKKKNKRGPKKGKSDLVKKRKKAESTSDDDSLFDDERDEDWDLPDGVQYYDNLCSAKKCLNPTGTKVDWVMCDNCEQWYHVECVDCSIEVIQKENVQFHCGLC
ncbi:proteoglycan 4-like isoform X1 [Physella acuta]|uniref:proteoglycan 4-like isoform X1 n=1 Tax=Physella acuta TaxID=109671 RepID=UPI0027DB0A35|nr:proteoglycan 4-like isoform X1 [Physella acuta]